MYFCADILASLKVYKTCAGFHNSKVMLHIQFNLGTFYLAQLVPLVWIFLNIFLLVGFALCGVQATSACLGLDILYPHISCEVVMVCIEPRADQPQTQASHPPYHLV